MSFTTPLPFDKCLDYFFIRINGVHLFQSLDCTLSSSYIITYLILFVNSLLFIELDSRSTHSFSELCYSLSIVYKYLGFSTIYHPYNLSDFSLSRLDIFHSCVVVYKALGTLSFRWILNAYYYTFSHRMFTSSTS